MCKVVACILCTLCILVIAIIVGMAVYVSHLKLPEAGIASVKIVQLDLLKQPATIDVSSVLWINNPNGWPITGDIVQAYATVYSLDKDDPQAPAYPVGVLSLLNPVDIAAHQNTSFTVSLNGVIQASLAEAPLIKRLARDCGKEVIGQEGTTMVGLNITSVEVSFWKKDYKLDNFSLEFNATVPCPSGVEQGVKDEPDAPESAKQLDSPVVI